jgi:hypothetical protein
LLPLVFVAMNERMKRLLFILVFSQLAFAKQRDRPPDVCALEYRNSAYHLYKGENIFSANIQLLDDAIRKEQGLIQNGICKSQKGVCNLRFDGLKKGGYHIYKDKKIFSGDFQKLSDAESEMDMLVENLICIVPD